MRDRGRDIHRRDRQIRYIRMEHAWMTPSRPHLPPAGGIPGCPGSREASTVMAGHVRRGWSAISRQHQHRHRQLPSPAASGSPTPGTWTARPARRGARRPQTGEIADQPLPPRADVPVLSPVQSRSTHQPPAVTESLVVGMPAPGHVSSKRGSRTARYSSLQRAVCRGVGALPYTCN
jgi:hypothetical protein